MIKIFIYSLLALGLGTFLAVVLADDPGYVLISFRGVSVESTLGTVLLSILLLYVFVFGLLWLIRLVNPLKLLKGDTWLQIFGGSNPAKASEKGLELLLLGHWQDAYKLLLENASRVDSPAFNYLAASIAAFKRGDKLAWSYCLDQAEKSSGASTSGIKNLKAALEFRSGGTEQALAILLGLYKQKPASPFVLEQIKNIYVSVSDWGKLAELLPALQKHSVLGEQELSQLTEKISLYQIEKASAAGLGALNKAWASCSKAMQKNENVTGLYLKKLLSFKQDEEAGTVLNRFLKHHWSDNLVGLFGFVSLENPQQPLLLLEGWLKERPKNAVLMLTLGRLSLSCQLWGKGREYFENALRSSSDRSLSSEINAELGRLLEHLGEHEKSLACYRRAMELMEKKLPDLPMPAGG